MWKILTWIKEERKKLQTFAKYIIGISFGISEERRKIYKL